MELAQRLLSTRRGSTILGIGAAVLAGIVLLVYVNQYRDSVTTSAAPVTVIVAKELIHKGTAGDIVGNEKLFQTSSIPKDQLRNGALTDPVALHGRVAANDVFPGQQLTVGDFPVAGANQISTKLTGDLRAVSIPVDSAHGLIGQLGVGDHVDVFAGFNVERGSSFGGNVPVIKLLMPNALVLEVPKKARSGLASTATNVVLRAPAQQAAEMAFAADNGKIWVVLRPSANAKVTKPSLVTAQSLLLGVPPVKAFQQVKALTGGGR
jgi:Flp pilus assembly protein CpaB